MLHYLKNIIPIFFCLATITDIKGQVFHFSGEAAAYTTSGFNDGLAMQAGLRYIPRITLDMPVNNKLTLDGEFSADTYINYSIIPDSSNFFDKQASFYRAWLRLSCNRFEIRAGLQKINFGSASMLRPLMWFDRIDPRDPLKITKGVYGLQGKYFFKNNANIWLWVLYGNKEPKGWETIPSVPGRPEIGGRIQLPVPKGEIAFSYDNREAQFPDDWQFPVTGSPEFNEQKFGLDFKVDLGIGLWFESTITHLQQNVIPAFSKAFTFGADYTLGIGNGLNIAAEHMLYNISDKLFESGTNTSFTGISASVPLSIITRLSVILFYDWKNAGLYRFANCSFTYDKFVFNVIGFWNPDNFGIFNYNSGHNFFAGYGGQFMVVYNY